MNPSVHDRNPRSGNWDMIVFDVDGTLLDREGFHEDLVKLREKG